MKFQDIPYERPDIAKEQENLALLAEQFKAADTFEQQWELMLQMNEMRRRLSTMAVLVSIRYSIDTLDPFYEKENEFMDEHMPQMEQMNMLFYDLLMESPFIEQFEEKLGEHFFTSARLTRKTFSEEILEDLGKENKLSSDYQKLLASAQIEFRGESYTLPGLQRFSESPDRQTRRESQGAVWGFFEDNAEKFDAIYDELVKLRDKMAKKLGYENFVQMGYDRWGRSDYGPKEVAAYREGIRKFLVPLASEIFEQQRLRLGLERLEYYDLPYTFPSGNPAPKGDKDQLVDAAMKMYDEMSEQTGHSSE